MNGGEGENGEDPESGEVDEKIGDGRFLRGEEKDEDPEEDEDDPVGEAVGEFEVVVTLEAEDGVSDDDDGEEKSKDEPDEDENGDG